MNKTCWCKEQREINLGTCTWEQWDEFVYHVAYEENGDLFHSKDDWERADGFLWGKLSEEEQRILEAVNPCGIA